MDKVVGIDLGTTNSVIAITEGSKPTVIPNSVQHHQSLLIQKNSNY
jgi:molecular chaperone DnaK (HSP70)